MSEIEGEISKFVVEAYGDKQQHKETYVITMDGSNETKCFYLPMLEYMKIVVLI